ncbi:MAG: WD40 repeat domain-containing serine/threonine protein kinase [Planctomycetaceae bacterium]
MSDDASESLSAARRVDARCDEFELALATGQSRQIESFLTDLPAAERQTLLLELLGLELDFRVARGEQPKVGDYANRFSELSAEQLAVIVEASRGRAGVIASVGSAVPNAEQPTILAPTDAVAVASAAAPGVLKRVRYFGDYELLREIARGGMGVVYEARQRSLNRPVALKMILSGQLASAEEVTRFRREAEAAAQLEHPGIVPIFEIGIDGDQHYFTMGYVSGPSLSARLRERPLEPIEAATLIRDVALAVQYAHERGVVHRDLKPSNILLAPRSDSSHVRQNVGGTGVRSHSGECGYDTSCGYSPRITDFGLAKVSHADHSLTETGQILGTPSYMPPEQAAGLTHQIGPAADIYSLGAVLYACLTGRPPFQTASVLDTVRQVLERDPVSLRDLNEAIPQDLETICLKCLEKSIPRRYSSAKDVADELQRYLEGRPIDARPVSRIERGWRWCRRNPAIAALTLGIVVSLMSGIVASTIFGIGERHAAKESKRQEGFANDNARDAQLQKGIAQRAEQTTRETLEKTQAARDEAQRELARARQRLYVGDVQLAAIALARGDIAATLRYLENQQPADDGSDLREWEWFYLRSNCFEHEKSYSAHERPIETVEWNPAGDRFAAADSAGNVSVWSVAGDEPLHQWPTGLRQPLRLSWDHSGQWLAAFPIVIPIVPVGPDQRRCLVWNVETGQQALSQSASDVAWHPTQSILAAADPSDGLWTWNGGDAEVTRVGVAQRVTTLTWLPNAEQLAIAMTDRVEIIRSDTGETLATLRGFSGELGCLSVSPEGRRLCGATRFVGLRPGGGYVIPPETVVAWNLANTEVAGTWKIAATAARLRWHVDGERFVVCPGATNSLKVTVHQIGHAEPLLTVDGFDASWHVSLPLLAVAERTGIGLFQTATRPMLKSRTLRGHLGQVYCVQWNPTAATLNSGGGDTTIRRWQAGDSHPKHLPRDASIVSTSSDERFQIIRQNDPPTSRVKLIDAQSGAVLSDMARGSSVTVFWSRSGNRVALNTATEIHPTERITGTLTAWETQPARQLWSIPNDSVRLLVWSPDAKQLLWSRYQARDQVQLAGAEDREVQSEWTLDGTVTGLVWSPTGKAWACAFAIADPAGGPASSKVEVRGIDGKLIVRLGVPEGCDGSRCRPEFSPDGRLLAWATFEVEMRRGRIFLWNLETREVVTELIGHDESVLSLTWNRTGTRIASGNFLGTKIWDVSSGLPLIELEKGAGAELRWSQSGHRLFGQVFSWDASRGFDHARTLPPRTFQSFVRPSVGGGFF